MVAIKNKSKKSGGPFGIRALAIFVVVAVTGAIFVWVQLRSDLQATGGYFDHLSSDVLSSLHQGAAAKETRPFTPEHVLDGKLDRYVCLPVLDNNVTYDDIQARVKRAMARKVEEPFGLMHQGHPPGHDVVMGLASWPSSAMHVFQTLVGSLRTSGFDGHIILGVHPEMSEDEQAYLAKMDVTFYAVHVVPCAASISDGSGGNAVRGNCAKGIEYLTLEKGRFEMSRQWLHACKECTGWALAMDTRDLFFQRPPFTGMPPPDQSPYDLLFIEEIAPHTQPKRDNPRTDVRWVSNGFYQGSDGGCYGHHYHEKYPDRAILCSGTIIGNRKGMDRFLAVFVDEFLENNNKPNPLCKSSQTPDQLTLQPMYYSGYFGDFERTRTSPWGTGPVNTIGVPCVDERNDPSHSALDLTEFDKATGLILNPNVKDGHPSRIAPIVHQYDRCHDWIGPFFSKYDKELFGGKSTPLDLLKPVPWLSAANKTKQEFF
jgi:hypothetical protein